MSIVVEPARLGHRSILLRSVKYDDSLNYSWPARVLAEDADGFIWYSPVRSPFTRPTGLTHTPYDWIGCVWYDRWYMVDASLVPAAQAGAAGVVHHYYCNIGAPGGWEDDTYRFVDLDLDVMVYPDGRHVLLDEDEFAAHQVRYAYPDETIAATRQAAADLMALARANAAPFDGIFAAYHEAVHAG